MLKGKEKEKVLFSITLFKAFWHNHTLLNKSIISWEKNPSCLLIIKKKGEHS